MNTEQLFSCLSLCFHGVSVVESLQLSSAYLIRKPINHRGAMNTEQLFSCLSLCFLRVSAVESLPLSSSSTSGQFYALRSRAVTRDALRLADHPFKFFRPRIGSVHFGHTGQITQQVVRRDLRRIWAARQPFGES